MRFFLALLSGGNLLFSDSECIGNNLCIPTLSGLIPRILCTSVWIWRGASVCGYGRGYLSMWIWQRELQAKEYEKTSQ